MPLPIETFRVYPNPWTHIDLKRGPQGCCTKAMREDHPRVEFVGATRSLTTTREASVVTVRGRTAAGPQGARYDTRFNYPGLNPALTGGTPEEVTAYPPDGFYYRDRLVDGSLVPADAETLAAVPESRFKSLAEAKAAAVADFDAHFGSGSFEQLEKKLSLPTGDTKARTAKQEGNS